MKSNRLTLHTQKTFLDEVLFLFCVKKGPFNCALTWRAHRKLMSAFTHINMQSDFTPIRLHTGPNRVFSLLTLQQRQWQSLQCEQLECRALDHTKLVCKIGVLAIPVCLFLQFSSWCVHLRMHWSAHIPLYHDVIRLHKYCDVYEMLALQSECWDFLTY